nr:hypothetical protein [Tanacetum cinerariifolium]
MAPLTFVDTYNIVAFLSKSAVSAGFDQIMDFLNAHTIQYALVVVVSEDVIRRYLHLDDADGVDCFPNEDIFVEPARMGYEKPPLKLTFYKVFFSAQWKFLIHTLVHCLSAKRTAWNKFICSMASAIICLATVDDLTTYNTRYTSPALTQKVFANMRRIEEEEEMEMPTALAPPSPTNAPSPPLKDPTSIPHASPPQDQPSTSPASPPQEQPTTTSESSITRYTYSGLRDSTTEEEVKEVGKEKEIKVFREDASKQRGGGKIEAIDADEDITLVDMEKDEEVVTIDAELQGRIYQEEVNAASKGVSAAEPTIFDDEEVTMTIAQTLIKMKAEKAELLDEQIA